MHGNDKNIDNAVVLIYNRSIVNENFVFVALRTLQRAECMQNLAELHLSSSCERINTRSRIVSDIVSGKHSGLLYEIACISPLPHLDLHSAKEFYMSLINYLCPTSDTKCNTFYVTVSSSDSAESSVIFLDTGHIVNEASVLSALKSVCKDNNSF